MGNCLKTQLKENVNNDNLKKIGSINIEIFNAIEGAGVKIQAQKNSVEKQVETSGSITKNATTYTGSGKVTILDKYDIDYFCIYGYNWPFNDVYISLDDLKYCNSIKTLNLTRIDHQGMQFKLEDVASYFPLLEVLNGGITNFIGDISSFIGCPLKFMDFEYVGNGTITGTMENLGKIENLENVNLNYANMVIGDLFDFVRSREALDTPQTTGSVTLKLDPTNITFGGETLSPTNSTLSWNGNQVTWGGVTKTMS